MLDILRADLFGLQLHEARLSVSSSVSGAYREEGVLGKLSPIMFTFTSSIKKHYT